MRPSWIITVFLFTFCSTFLSFAEPYITPQAGWIARHGLTSAQYQAEFDAQVQQHHRLTYVSGYQCGNDACYAALWEVTPPLEFVARHGMTASQFQQEFDTQLANGLRLVLVNGYSIHDEDFYVGIWERRDGPEWQARHGLTSEQYQDEFTRLSREGYRLSHVSGYSSQGEARYAAIWEKKVSPPWIARHGLTASAYQQEFTTQHANGYRLTQVSGYFVRGEELYAAIWEKSDSAPWQARHGVSSSSYQEVFDDFRYQGYRPLLVQGYTNTQGETRYVGLWHNYAFSSADLTHIDTVAERSLRRWSLPSLSFALTKEGRLVFAKTYGYSDKDNNIPAHTADRYRIASISKPITSAAILRLKEQGILSLDDKVFGQGAILGTEYGSTPYSSELKQITVQNLLQHTSGGWQNDDNDPMWNNRHLNQKELISWTLDNRPLEDTPGTVHKYSNFGYCLLGRIVEKKTGQSYDAWVKNNIFSPSGISRMEIAGDTWAERKPQEVFYYDPDAQLPYKIKVSRMDSHGGWIATPIDLVRFAVRVDGFPTKPDIFQDPGTLSLMTMPWKTGADYAMGWAVNNVPNWWHTGRLPGTTSILVRTSGEFTWAAVTNTWENSPDLDGMMWEIVNGVSSWPSYDLF